MNRLILALAALLLTATSIADDEENTSTRAKISKTFQLKPPPVSSKCVATATLDYFQRGDEAQVETSIDTEDCSAASGSYIVKLTIRSDTDGKQTVLDVEESWERTEVAPVESMRRYLIGDGMELRKVRVRKLSCTCAEDDSGTTSKSSEHRS